MWRNWTRVTTALAVSHGAARWKRSIICGTGVADPDNAAMKALKPAGLIRMGAVSISTSSAARTAASRTKSVRERPRSAAARSMMAMSVSGSRIESGCSLRSTDRGMVDLHGSTIEFVAHFAIQWVTHDRDLSRVRSLRIIS